MKPSWPKEGLPLAEALDRIAREEPNSPVAKAWRNYIKARDALTEDDWQSLGDAATRVVDKLK